MKLKIKDKLKLKKTWVVISSILFVVLVVSIFTSGFDFVFGSSANKIGEKAIEFVNNNMIGPGQTISLVKVDCDRGVDLCKVNFDLSGRSIDAYISSDKKIFFPQAINIEGEGENNQSNNQGEEVPVSQIPEVNLFVMSYCPYGLQSQKAMLPVMDLLKEEADIKINFVNYAMHDKKEIDENLKQYCLQNQDYDKYIDYLECFVKEDDSESCVQSSKVNKEKLASCIQETDDEYKITEMYNNKDTWKGSYPSFVVEDDLNEKYKVGGSPTLVINGVTISSSRTPEAYKNIICNAFEEKPEDCEKTLSESSPIPGFGVEITSGTNTEAQCD